MDPVVLGRTGFVRMTAKHSLCPAPARMSDGTVRHFRCKPQPARVEAVNEPRQRLGLAIELLEQQEEWATENVRYPQAIPGDERVELMAVNGNQFLSGVLPAVFLEYRHADQVRHQSRQSAVVVAFHPYDLDFALGIRQFADIGQKAPVVFREAPEVQVAKDVSQQDQAAERH